MSRRGNPEMCPHKLAFNGRFSCCHTFNGLVCTCSLLAWWVSLPSVPTWRPKQTSLPLGALLLRVNNQVSFYQKNKQTKSHQTLHYSPRMETLPTLSYSQGWASVSILSTWSCYLSLPDFTYTSHPERLAFRRKGGSRDLSPIPAELRTTCSACQACKADLPSLGRPLGSLQCLCTPEGPHLQSSWECNSFYQ